MATLQKFKFLATQCAAVASPTRSPTTSPVVHLRRRKTLRMLLGRTASASHHRRFPRRPDPPPEDPPIDNSHDEERRRHQICVRQKLKDLFVSSPPPLADGAKKIDAEEAQGLLPATGRHGDCGGGLVVAGRIGASAMRPLSATLRQRLLRRAWRPVLVAIPEQSP